MTFSELKALKLQLHRTDSELAAEIRRTYSAVDAMAEVRRICSEMEAAARDAPWFPEEPVELPEYVPPYDDSEPAWVKRLEDKLDILLERRAAVGVDWAVGDSYTYPYPKTNYTP